MILTHLNAQDKNFFLSMSLVPIILSMMGV